MWSKLVDMAMTEEEMADNGYLCGPALDRSNAPQYPYALRIAFTDGELEKLDLDVRAASVGDMIDMRAFGTVTSISENQKADGTTSCRVEIQIEKISIEQETDE